jgi:hypothetical protein
VKARVLKPVEVTPAMLKECVGRVISERPYVKILAEPTYIEDEVVPGMLNGEWRALAQVNETLALITVTMREQL